MFSPRVLCCVSTSSMPSVLVTAVILGSCVRLGVHGRATVIDGFGSQFVVPGLVAVDLAQPVLGAVLGQPRRGIKAPMSTASPDAWTTFSAVATHRAASSRIRTRKPPHEEADSGTPAKHQPLSTNNSTPSSAASVAAWRRAPTNRGRGCACSTGISSSKTVVPSGTALSGSSPSTRGAHCEDHGAHSEVRRWVMRPSRTRTPATGSRGPRRSPR